MKGGNVTRGVVGAALAAAATLAGGSGAPASGQDGVWVPSTQPAWLGISYDVEWLATAGSCESRVVIESVVQGAPADRAGLRPGDALVSVNGSPPGRSLQLASSRLAVGDSVRLRVVRDGRVRELLAVAGRRPDRPPLALRGGKRDGLVSSDAPVIRVRADTLVARNLELTGFRGSRGYWIASDDGKARYRRADRFSGDAMDRQVVDLLLCAARTQSAAPPAPRAIRVDVRELQARADSVREVLVRRSQARHPQARSVSPVQVRAGVRFTPPDPDLPPHAAGAPEAPYVSVYSFSVADHVSAAERGVAGAEVTELEPELAEYFRGVRDGLLVLRVAPGTPADRAGLRPGDVITAGGGRALDAVQDLRLLLTVPDPTPVELRVVRQGRTRVVTVQRD